jgi:hypothetical protein
MLLLKAIIIPKSVEIPVVGTYYSISSSATEIVTPGERWMSFSYPTLGPLGGRGTLISSGRAGVLTAPRDHHPGVMAPI